MYNFSLSFDLHHRNLQICTENRNTGQRNQIKEMYSLKIRIHQFEAVLTQQENCWRLNRLESWPCCGWGRGAPRCRAATARTGWRWWSLPPPACWRSTARPSSRWGPAALCPRRSPAESLANIIFSPIENVQYFNITKVTIHPHVSQLLPAESEVVKLE